MKIINFILLTLFKNRFIRNYRKDCKEKIGHALLYYKTDPLILRSLARTYSHTNYWEIVEIVRILNKLGFWVDILDRDIAENDVDKIENKYDLFIGIGAGNSGKYYANLAKKLTKAKKIFYALGPEPELSNQLILDRYEYFHQRHPDLKVDLRRMITKINIDESMRYTDAIFCGGSKFSTDSYAKFKKAFYKFYCPSSPNISFDLSHLGKASRNKYVYIGGNGNIVKGLDIIIETFAGMPEYELHICAPESEKDFNEIYMPIIKNSPNIKFHGFIEVGGQLFNKITSECGYAILLSCSEGVANSLITCMKRGLVPIANNESGIDNLEKFGYTINSIEIKLLQERIREISKITHEEFIKKSQEAYFESFNYSQARFSENFEKSIINVMS